MDGTALKRMIDRRGASRKSLAAALGVTPRTLQNKLGGRSQFKEGEIRALAQALGLTMRQVNRIFFDWGVNENH